MTERIRRSVGGLGRAELGDRNSSDAGELDEPAPATAEAATGATLTRLSECKLQIVGFLAFSVENFRF